MKTIEHTSLVLLLLSLLLLAMVGAAVAFQAYTPAPPTFTAVPLDKDFSYAQTVREATSLEGLRKVCAFWAEREDQSRVFVNSVHDQYDKLLRDVVLALVSLGLAFGAGLIYIYFTARRLQRS